MSIEDLHGLTPIPALDPNGLGVAPPPMAPAPLPPPPQVGQPSESPTQKIMTLAAIASMLAGGRATTGLGSGMLQARRQSEMERQQREAVQMNERRYQEQQAQQQQIQFQREQAQWQQTLQARQQTLMKAVGDIRQQVSKLPNKGAYDQQIEGFANLLRSSGYRVDSNWLRRAVPYAAPNAKEMAQARLADWLKNEQNAKLWKDDPERAMIAVIPFDQHGTGQSVDVPMVKLLALADMAPSKNPMTGKYELPLQPMDTKLKANADGILQTLLEMDAADGIRPSKERTLALQQRAIKIAAEAKPKDGSDPNGLAAELAAARLELLRAQGAKAKADAAAATGAGPGEAYAAERTQRIVQDVDALLPRVNKWTVGVGALLNGVPTTDAANFDADLESLKANISFGELTEMRAASKTGGALGQVSNIELGLLSSALGSLNTKQSPEAFKRQLKKIKASLQRWEAAKRGMAAPMSSHDTPKPGGKTYGKYTFEVERP